MAGKNIEQVAANITGVTGRLLTLDSVTGLYEGAIVWLNDSSATDANNKRAQIMEIDTGASTIWVAMRPDTPSGGVSYGGLPDMTIYNGGTVTQLEQFVYNNDDAPLS